MARTITIALLLVLWASQAAAQQLRMTVDDRTEISAHLPLEDDTIPKDNVAWIWSMPTGVVFEQGQGDETHKVWIDNDSKPGNYRANVTAMIIDWNKRSFMQLSGYVDFTVGKKDEDDGDDDEQDPDEDDEEDDSSAPFPTDGFTVLIIREAGGDSSMTVAQQAVFTSVELIQFLNSACFKDSDGYPAYRVWDDDYTAPQLVNATPMMRNAYTTTVAKASGNMPWIAISDGKKGTSEPLPGNVEDTLELIRKYQ